MPKQTRIHIEGSFFIWHSLAHVNRELGVHLARAGMIVTIAPAEKPPKEVVYPHQVELTALIKKPSKDAVRVRHAFPPNLAPSDGPTVLMQPWEFFAAPTPWVDFALHSAAELWVNSTFARMSFVRSGVPPEKVFVLPLGFDPKVFSPQGEPWPQIALPGEFRFLFVGGTIGRKGADLLLNAYLQEFQKDDPVRLVIKDSGTKHVYRHNNLGDAIRQASADKGLPKITYVEEDLPPGDLAKLIRTCHCGVFPYRGEGFCLPALEAMACGLPVIVTSGGSTDDLVIQATGWRVASTPAPIEQLPGLESHLAQAWLEPDILDLRAKMREAFSEARGATQRFGQNAAALARQMWTWESAALRYAERIEAVAKSWAKSPAKRPTISLCMIVKNEERVLEACLSSAKPYFDEIIIVDTGSKDRTKEIAANYADKLVDFKWVDSFSAARNESLRHATSDWIFWMDADDTLPIHTGEAIRNAAQNAPPDIHGFVVPVQFVNEGPASGTRVDHVKLIRRLPGLEFEGRIHEQILPSLSQHGGRIGRLQALVLHSGYDSSPEGQARKRKRDAKLLKLDLKDNPDHPFRLFNQGMTHHYNGEHAGAVRWLDKCLAVSGQESHVRKVYAMKAVSLWILGRHEEALKTLDEGIERVGNDPELRFQQGRMLTELSRPAEAKAAYLQMDLDTSGYYSSVDVGILGPKRLHNLAIVSDMLGDYIDSRSFYLEALRSWPDNLLSAFLLFDSALSHKDKKTAVDMLEHVRALEGPSGNWSSMARKYALSFEGIEGAIRLLHRASQDFPEAIGPRLDLMRVLLQGERDQEALPLMVSLQEAGVAEAAYCLGIYHVRRGNFKEALKLMERALELNPGHEETAEQIRNLQKLVSE